MKKTAAVSEKSVEMFLDQHVTYYLRVWLADFNLSIGMIKCGVPPVSHGPVEEIYPQTTEKAPKCNISLVF